MYKNGIRKISTSTIKGVMNTAIEQSFYSINIKSAFIWLFVISCYISTLMLSLKRKMGGKMSRYINGY